jgi:hypothetical protein
METLNKHFRTLTAPAFKKHGFAQGDVLAQWPIIVGDKLARISRPEKIRWPRSGDEAQGGTLQLQVLAGHGLDVEYAASAIIEKVNQYLGYQAIKALKVRQAHGLTAQAPAATAVPEPSADVLNRVSTVEDKDLHAALARLGAGVFASTPRSPQAK